MKLDKFGNLFYVDRNVQAIVKIVSANLTNPVTNTKAQIVYSANETEKMRRVEAITIEREYLYWTNVQSPNESDNGAIHKAFTQPFVKPEPFYSFLIPSLSEAFSIASNDNFLFFSARGKYPEIF